MILSDRDIKKRLEKGDLVIEPLDNPELQIQPASIDLRLGSEFMEFKRSNIPCIHPDIEEETEEYTRKVEVDQGDEYVLHPGDFVLGTTYETVEIPNDLVARVEGRSSLGRLAIVVHASLPYEEEVFLWTPMDGFGFYEIGEIVENEVEARAVSFNPETLSVDTHRVTDHITNPPKRIYRVTLESGREVKVTEDHNLFTISPTGEVTRIESRESEGELVMVPDKLPEPTLIEEEINLAKMFTGNNDVTAYAKDGYGFNSVDWNNVPSGSHLHYNANNSAPVSAVSHFEIRSREVEYAFKQSTMSLPSEFSATPEFAWILGFYIAEGYSRRQQIVFTNKDKDLLDRVAKWFEEWDAPLYWSQREDGVRRVTVCSALWSGIFQKLAGEGKNKDIPEEVWNWSDELLRSLLEGLIAGDGSRRETRDTYYTFNENLANNVMYLSSRLGLLNSMYHRERETGVEWNIDMAEDSHKRGQYIPIPNELLREYRQESGMDLREAADLLGYASKSSISNVENREYRSVKRGTLEKYRELYSSQDIDTERLDNILDGDVRFERVENVEETDRVETTYDLEVQPNGRRIENFIGGKGGVFLSNTAGWVDAGYRGQITLELSNLGTAPVALRPLEMRISQLVILQLSSEVEVPYGEERGSKYQDQRGPTASRIQDDEEWREG